jgi:basic membrane protein A
MTKFSKGGLLVLSLMLVLAVAGAGFGTVAAAEKFKVGFVYVGAVGDAGWTFAHDQGKKYLEKKLPNVQTTIVENVPEGADAERVITELAEKGNRVIFTTSFGFMDPTIKVAAKYPKVTFMHCSGYKTAKNVGTYFGRDYEARYLAGIVAGKSTKNNTIGYVGAFPIPEVVRGINGFTLGAQSVNPKVKVKVVWTSTWYDPAKEKEAAMSLLNAGCDVIAQHQDTPAPMQAAEEKGALGLGYNSDMRTFAPKAVMTGPIWNWGPYYTKVVKSVMNHTWKPGQYWGGISSGIIDIGPYGPMVSKEIKDLVAKKRGQMVKDDYLVFVGPLKNNTGELKLKTGEKMTDAEMLSFDWFVQGVEGKVK